MGEDHQPLSTTWTGNYFGTDIYMGEEREVILLQDWEGHYDLYHEEDYRAIADQLLAEDLGLA